MPKRDDIERWVRQVAGSAELRELRERAQSAPELPEDVLARYHAGLLSAEEEALFAHRLVLGEKNLRALADLDGDIEDAAVEAPPALWDRAKRAIAAFGAFWRSPAHGFRFASAVAGAALLVVLMLFLPQAPPGGIPPTYSSPLVQERPRGGGPTMTLPGGRLVDQVDPAWPLVSPPAGDVDADAVRWFVWAPLGDRRQYHLQVFAPDGRVVYEKASSSPAVRLRWWVRRELEPGVEYVWMVEVSDETEGPVVRGVSRFRIRGPQ